jgi:hypothetical protein
MPRKIYQNSSIISTSARQQKGPTSQHPYEKSANQCSLLFRIPSGAIKCCQEEGNVNTDETGIAPHQGYIQAKAVVLTRKISTIEKNAALLTANSHGLEYLGYSVLDRLAAAY